MLINNFEFEFEFECSDVVSPEIIVKIFSFHLWIKVSIS